MHVGYARLSTQDQKSQLQFDALEEAGCEWIFQENTSGGGCDSPTLKEVLAFLGEGDTLVVWKLDRLARSLRQLIDTIEELEERGIGFRSLTENIDTTTPGGGLVFHIFGALAEFERSIMRERTAAGRTSAREQGRLGGRPRAMSAEDIAIAKTLLADPAISVKEVARRQGVSVSTLYKHIPAARSTSRKSTRKA